SWLPLYHDMGLVGFFLTPMTCQLTVDMLPTREFARRPHVWLDLISRNRGTLAYSPSFGYELCARRPAAEGLDLSSWRVAGIGGDMIRPHILEIFAERFASAGFDKKAFEASYGMAEATLAISFAPLNTGIQTDTVDLSVLESQGLAVAPKSANAPSRTFVLCGKVLPHHGLEVRDAEGNVLPDRTVGTIFVRGPSLMDGYFRQPEETIKAIDTQKWLNTGDLGYMLNGQIVVTGRAKDLIIINGRNIWPQDLEWSAENELPTLRSRDVAVFSLEKGEQEEIVALIQCRATTPETREELRSEAASLFRRLHGVEVSVVLEPPHALPQTSSGKLTRAKARTMFLSGVFEPQPEVEPA
ncbi:MAG: AMP-binding protein, partial [Acetobacter orientalis]|uniref:AMP-binding protein n=1 Tax=Acetobacter orientalis TaxID=146474 RepID=UPI0039E92B8B